MKKLIFTLVAILATRLLFAGDKDSLDLAKYFDSVRSALKYETGTINLPNKVAKLSVPAGFKFLNAAQSKYVITELWGNPPREDVDGMIFPVNADPFSDSSYAFIVSYDAMGYVKDEDADEMDYDKLLKQMQEEEPEENKERVKKGYSTIHMVGWAQKPYYDKENKVLHWAKELKFGDDGGVHTLNYDVRILGRKGILSLNAVGTMAELPLVKKDIDQVLHMATFTEGNAYKDFDSNIDEVAAWTIGGLVAGKLLAKAGILVLLAKFWKLIAVGVVAAGGFIMKLIKRKKNEEPEVAVAPVENNDETNA